MTDIRIASVTDPGPRDNLEDAYMTAKLGVPHQPAAEVTLVVTCDGVGGERGGEYGSSLACQEILGHLTAFFMGSGPAETAAAIPGALWASLIAANEAVRHRAAREPGLCGMATTVVCAVIQDSTLLVGWAGDSRCYVYQNGSLRRLTQDHSEVQALIDAGLITEQERNFHPLAHAIYRYLGQEAFEPAVASCRLRAKDVIVITTDGLTDVVADDVIAESIRGYRLGRFDLEELAQRLLAKALQAPATDNITVVCCCYEPSVGRTLTGAYRIAAAQALHQISKESDDARRQSPTVAPGEWLVPGVHGIPQQGRQVLP